MVFVHSEGENKGNEDPRSGGQEKRVRQTVR